MTLQIKMHFCRLLDHVQKTYNFELANALAEIEVSFTK